MDQKGKKIISTAIISLFIISMLATVPLALAQPTLTISPATVPPGTSVTYSGSGYTNLGEVRVYLDGVLVDTTYANETGAISDSFTVPDPKPAGWYTVRALDVSTGAFAQAGFVVEPEITLTPTSGPPGTSVTVSGKGFAASKGVNITWDGKLWGTTTTNIYGSFSVALVAPDGTVGVHTVKATDTDGNWGEETFTISTPVITLTPNTGSPGDTVTVSGTLFKLNSAIDITWDGAPWGTDTTDATGAFSVDLIVPDATQGAHTVMATDGAGNYDEEAFTVVPKITLTPASGSPGTSVTVTGKGFTGSSTVDITFDVISWATGVKTDATGSFSASGLIVPDSTYNGHTVMATDGAGNYDEEAFTVVPKITLTPASGSPGTSVTVTGKGFTGSSTVDITFDVISWATGVTTDATGSFSASGLIVPDSTYNGHTVTATDAAGKWDSETFTVGPIITLTPTSGPIGTSVTVTGKGFTGSSTVDITFDVISWATGVTTDATGSFSASGLIVPDSTYNGHTVTATDAAGKWDSETFTIPESSIVLDPTKGLVGSEVTVTGSGFKIGATVNIYFDGTLVASQTATGPTGAIDTTFKVPDVLTGEYTVTATDGINPATATFQVEGAGGTTNIIDMLNNIIGKLWSNADSLKNETKAIEAKLDLLVVDSNTNGVPDFIEMISAIEGKLDVIGPKIDSIKTAVETDIPATLSLIKAKTDTINWADINALTTAVADIEAKLDALPTFGDLVTKNWADLTGYIDSAKSDIIYAIGGAKSDILSAISGVQDKLDLLVVDSNTNGVPDFIEEIDAIKAKTDTINWADITTIKTEIGDISADSGRASWTTLGVALNDIKTEIEGIDTDISGLLTTAHFDNAIANLLTKSYFDSIFTANRLNNIDLIDDIYAKLNTITAGAQANSGSGITTFTASGSTTIYTGTKVGTVTVSISTSGIGYGESLRIRYYIDPANPGLYIQKTVVTNTNTAGWTDTAAAWKVVIDYTGSGTVNWAYSVIYPPS